MKPKYKKLAEFAEAIHTVAGIYRPDITYSYEIDGEKYTNNTVRPVGRNVYRDKPIVQRVLNLFPVGYNVYIFYNPKNISVDVTEEEITIKSKKEEGTSRFVKDIDLTLTVGTDYDGTKTTASFDNGLLTLLIDKKVNKKAKTLKISY